MNGKGFANIAEGITGGFTARDEAKRRKQEMEMKMAQHQQNLQAGEQSLEARQLQMDTLMMQNRKMSMELAKQRTYEAFDSYTADFNPRHLNLMLKDNPEVANTFGIVNFSKIDPHNDYDLIVENGLDPVLFTDKETKDNSAGRLLKTIDAQGNTDIIDMSHIYAGTGYTRKLNDDALKRLVTLSSLTKKGGTSKDFTADKRRGLEEADSIIRQREMAGETLSEDEKQRIKDEKVQQHTRAARVGKTGGMVDEATKQYEELITSTAGQKLLADESLTKYERERLWPSIHSLMKYEGADFDTKAEREDASQIGELIDLAKTATSELTEQQTGLLDKALFNVKKFADTQLTGAKGIAAYNAFRNTYRHSLFGAALTKPEIEAFEAAFGSDKQKLGPMLQQFEVAVAQVESKLNAATKFKNPILAKYFFGADQRKLQRVQEQLRKRIEFIQNYDKGLIDIKNGEIIDLRNPPATKSLKGRGIGG